MPEKKKIFVNGKQVLAVKKVKLDKEGVRFSDVIRKKLAAEKK